MLDGVSQEFMAYRAPRHDDVSEADFERYWGVVDQVYGSMTSCWAGTCVWWGRRRRSSLPRTTASGGRSAVGPRGAGPRIVPPAVRHPGRARAARSLGTSSSTAPPPFEDVAPTVLTLLGLPVGRDMEGRAPRADLRGARGARLRGFARLTDGDAGRRGAGAGRGGAASRSPRLRAGGPEGPGVGEARLEQIANEAEVHFCRGDWRKAADLFTEVLSRRPEHVIAQYRLVQCRLRGGDVAGAGGWRRSS